MKLPSFDTRLFAAIIRRRLLISLPLLIAGSLVFTAIDQSSQMVTIVKQPHVTILQTTSNNSSTLPTPESTNSATTSQMSPANQANTSISNLDDSTTGSLGASSSNPTLALSPTMPVVCTDCVANTNTLECQTACQTQTPSHGGCGGCDIATNPKLSQICPMYMCTAL